MAENVVDILLKLGVDDSDVQQFSSLQNKILKIQNDINKTLEKSGSASTKRIGDSMSSALDIQQKKLAGIISSIEKSYQDLATVTSKSSNYDENGQQKILAVEREKIELEKELARVRKQGQSLLKQQSKDEKRYADDLYKRTEILKKYGEESEALANANASATDSGKMLDMSTDMVMQNKELQTIIQSRIDALSIEKSELENILNDSSVRSQYEEASFEAQENIRKSIEAQAQDLANVSQQILNIGKFGESYDEISDKFKNLDSAIKGTFNSIYQFNEEMRKVDKTPGDFASAEDRDNLLSLSAKLIAVEGNISRIKEAILEVNRYKINPDVGNNVFTLTAQIGNLLAKVKDINEEIAESERLAKNAQARLSRAQQNSRMIERGTYSGKETAESIQAKIEKEQEELEIHKANIRAGENERANYEKQVEVLEEKLAIQQRIGSDKNFAGQVYTEGVEEAARLNEQLNAEQENYRKIDATVQDIAKNSQWVKSIQDSVTESVKRTASATKDLASRESDAVKQARQNLSVARQRTSSTYYALRSAKMLSYTVSGMYSSLLKFDKAFISTMLRSVKMMTTLAGGFLFFRRSVNQATKSHNGFLASLKGGFTTILKYTLGIRSLYFLVNKLRNGLVSAMGELAQSSNKVNAQMSSLMNNIKWMRNMLATVAQPILNVLVPAIEKVAVVFEKATYAVASFFATLTGQSFVYKAIKPTEDYAASLDSAASSAKKATKAVREFDKLNVITTNSGSDSGSSGGAGFEEVERLAAASKLAEDLKSLLAKLFDPILQAWKDKGQFVMDAWKYALNEVWQLIKSIGRDFLEVWGNDVGVQIWKDIFQIIGDIGLIIGNLAKNLREAWDENERGKRLFLAIQKLIAIIIEDIRKCADYTVEWSEKLDFRPLLDALIALFEGLAVPIQHISDMFEYFYENVVLKFTKYMVEDGGPKLLLLLSDIANAIDWEQLQARLEPFMDAFEKFLELGWETFLIILEDVGMALADIVNSDAFGYILEKFEEWVNNADPEDLANKLETFAKVLGEITLGLKIFQTTLEIVTPILTFANAFNNLFIIKPLIKDLTKAISGSEAGAGSGGLIGAVRGIPEAFSTLTQIDLAPIGGATTTINTFGEAIRVSFIDALGPVGATVAGIVAVIGGLALNITAFKDSITGDFTLMKEVFMILGVAIATVGAIILGVSAWPAIVAGAVALIVENIAILIAKIIEAPEEMAAKFNEIGEWFGSLPEKFEQWFQGVLDKVHEFGENIGKNVGEWIAGLPERLSGWFDSISTFIDEVDWAELGINILKGILFIFTLPFRLLGYILEAIGAFLSGFIEGFASVFDSHSPAQTMVPLGENIINGILEGVIGIITDIGSWIKEHIFQPIFDGASNLLNKDTFTSIGGDLIEGLKNGISDKWNKLKDTVGGIWSKVTEGAKSIFGVHSPSTVFNSMGQNLIAGLHNGLDDFKSIINVFKDMLKQIEGEMQKILSSVVTVFSNMSDKAKAVIDSFKDSIVKTISTLKDSILKILGVLKDNFIAVIKALIDTVTKSITAFKESLLKLFTALKDESKKILDAFTKMMTSGFDTMSTSTIKIVTNLKKSVLDIFSDLSNGVKSTINTMLGFIQSLANGVINGVNAAIRAINGIRVDVPSWLSDLTGVRSIGFNIPTLSTISIPRLAQGAVIPPNKEFIAMLGDQSHGTNIEAPLDTIVEAFNTAGGKSSEEELKLLREQNKLLSQILAKNVSIASRDIFNAVRTESRDYYNRTGNSAFLV